MVHFVSEASLLVSVAVHVSAEYIVLFFLPGIATRHVQTTWVTVAVMHVVTKTCIVQENGIGICHPACFFSYF